MKSFDDAYNSFQPAADDNPECIPFYRTWAGLRAVWGEEFVRKYHWAVHKAACDAVDGYAGALASMRRLAAESKAELQPRIECGTSSPPTEPTEQDARRLFQAGFKKKYPGQRVKSKFGRSEWERLRDTAGQVARTKWENDVGFYEANEKVRRKRNERLLDAWRARERAREEFQADVRRLA